MKDETHTSIEELEKEFFKRFGNVFDYEDEHTKWWVAKIHEVRQEAIAQERERIKKELDSISTREIDGSWLPDDMHAYYDDDLEKFVLPPHTVGI